MNRDTGMFSERHGFRPEHDGRLVYDDVPMKVRAEYMTILQTVLDNCSGAVRHCALKVLRQRPNPHHNSTQGDAHYEIATLLQNAPWYGVLDVVEAVHSIANDDGYLADGDEYEHAVNRLFVEYGIGWKLVAGRLDIRGAESFELLRERTSEAVNASPYDVAASELNEAWSDLSRRPEPDVSGAATHALAALEALAREFTSDVKSTLGEIIKKHPGTFPPPVDDAVTKLWGYASNEARHGKEKRNLELDEVLLLVGICATLADYLIRKMPLESDAEGMP